MSIITSKREQGSTIVVALGLIIVIVVATTAFLVVAHANKNKKTTANSTSSQQVTTSKPTGNTGNNKPAQPESSTKSEERNSRNVGRANDASALLAAALEYQNNNSGQFPEAYSKGVLSGGEGTINSTVQLQSYFDASVTEGAQSALTKDTIKLVTRAVCGDGGATVSANNRSMAVQYATEGAGDIFTGKCLD